MATITVDRSTSIGVSNYVPGLNWIQNTLGGNQAAITSALAIMKDALQSGGARGEVCTHFYFFGMSNPWLNPGDTAAQMVWGGLDNRINKLWANGHDISVTIGLTPPWMIPAAGGTMYTYGLTSGGTKTVDLANRANYDDPLAITSFDQIAPHTTHFGDIATLVSRFLTHQRNSLTPTGVNKIASMQLWNEMKGFEGTTPYRYVDLTTLYNDCWSAVQSFNTTLGPTEQKVLMGGPYFNTPHVTSNTRATTDPSYLLVSAGSWVDPRSLDAALYWKAHALGYDFVCFDGTNQHPDVLCEWVKTNFPGKPFKWNEFYSNNNQADALEVKRAQLAYNMLTAIQHGVHSLYLWQPEWQSGERFQEQGLWTDTSISGGGQRLATADIVKNLGLYFPAGTVLYQTTSSDPNVTALASADATMIVNQNTSSVTITLS